MIQELTIFFVFQTYADSIKGYTEWSRRGAALVEWEKEGERHGWRGDEWTRSEAWGGEPRVPALHQSQVIVNVTPPPLEPGNLLDPS